ncbi:MAG: glycosyltransferase family 4 protein [Fervidobacterium sp.]|uniref:glycosyltransferase family 4 protein n=1 Tax=Fervidobacterium sp. TaxID=1871331 RepID=UPI0025B96ED0|nr:glycosyltransferase family 4 protein [Fervidobacterium sp.]NPU89508.1 glycosyltransferase family 4 protein [Fervidobacterium sp.]
MKIAIVSVDNSKLVRIGGKHVHQNLLEKALLKLGHEVGVFYPVPIRRLNVVGKLKVALWSIASAPFEFIGSDPIFFAFKSYIRYYERFFRKMDFSEYDLVHAHDVVSAVDVNFGKIVLTLHGYYAKEVLNYNSFRFKKEKLREKIYSYCYEIEKAAIEKADFIIAVDSRIKDYIVSEFSYPSEKIAVIYNAVDTERFSPVSEKEKALIRKELGLPLEKLIVLVPRRYVDKNGVQYAARAFARMKDSDFYFVFAGEGPLKGLIEETLKGKQNVKVMGGIPNTEVHRYYQASDVILVPSITSKEGVEEATSLTMLEGMACGKIVICSNVGGMKEVIKDGKNGFLIEQKSEEAIIEKLVYVKDNYDKLEEIRKMAREYVIQNHGYIEHAKKVLEVYEKVLDSVNL